MNPVRFLKVFIVCFSFLLLSSCGFKDIDKRVFIQAIGVDHTGDEEKPYKVTLKLAVPSGSLKESGSKYEYLSTEDSNLAGAIRFLKTHVDKELDFGHTKAIIIGEEVLKEDLINSMDFFIRRRDIQMISWVGVGKPTAEKVLKVEPQSEMSGSNVFSNLFSGNGVESAYIVSTYLFDARRKVLENGIDLILPIIRASEDGSKVMINQSFVINDQEKSLEVNSQQTKIFSLMANRIDKMEIEVKEKEKNFSLSVDTAKSKFKIITSPGKPPLVKMDIKIVGTIEESNFEMWPEKLDKYSKKAANHAKKEVLNTLKHFQKANMDPMGFGLRYKATRISNGKRYEEWKELYPNLKFDVNVDVNIRSTGTTE